MKRIFKEVRVDASFDHALEKRLVAVMASKGRGSWRTAVWPMAVFGVSLAIVLLVVGVRYIDLMQVRESNVFYQSLEADLIKTQTDISTDGEIEEAISYLGM